MTTRVVLVAGALWATAAGVGYVLGRTFESDTSGDIAFTLVGLPQLAIGFGIVVVSLIVAAWIAWDRRRLLAVVVACAPLWMWAGWELAARL
jgi:hypothetical protein